MTTTPISPVTWSSPSLLWEPQKHLPTPQMQENIQTITKRLKKIKERGAYLVLYSFEPVGTITPLKEMLQLRVEV